MYPFPPKEVCGRTADGLYPYPEKDGDEGRRKGFNVGGNVEALLKSNGCILGRGAFVWTRARSLRLSPRHTCAKQRGD